MSSSEDGDLIDLGNDVCVPRIDLENCTPEEQEHLLDVCPPKLEETLSLTGKQQQIHSVNDSGDVLVTLGHDQVVPIHKRIDVVSSDTIKRIRDITRNLEPVIRKTCAGINENFLDTVDHASGVDEEERFYLAEKDDETFEAQEINNAFNFLADHEDTEQSDEAYTESPINPDTARPVSEDGTSDESLPRYSRDLLKRDSSELGEPVHQSSPRRVRSVSMGFEVEPACRRFVNGLKEEALVGGSKRHHRKSWTEGVSLKSSRRESLPSLDKSMPLGEYSCEPSTSDGSYRQSSFITSLSTEDEESSCCSQEEEDGSEVDWSWLEEVECCPRGAATSGAQGSSTTITSEGSPGSEEEEEVAAAASSSRDADGEPRERDREQEQEGSASPTSESRALRRACEHCSTDAACSVAMPASATGKSLDAGGGRWSSPGADAPLTRHADENGDGTRRNLEQIDREGQQQQQQRDGQALAGSWLRASMRRLRHLRLPEGTERQRSAELPGNSRRGPLVSAPNSLPDIALIAPEILAAQTNGTSGTLLRPSSAPVRNTNSTSARRADRQSRQGRLQPSRTREASSRQSSVASTATTSDTTGSSSTTCSSSFGAASSSPPSSTATSPQRTTSRRICERQRDVEREEERGEDEDEDANPLGKWPHALSPALACLGCTLGLFNISRFAILSIQFGANFIVQFLILSLVLGIPLLTLQVCLGQRLAAGSVDMWRISPLFQGVGIALLTAQAFIGIYSIVGVSWMFVYFRDSFITKQDRYRWAEPFLLYREDSRPSPNSSISYKLHETVPDYFSGAVLQRHHLTEPDAGVVTLKFQVAFNLAVVWMIVFVSLSKGLRSYGKVVYVFTLVPVFGTLVLCTKLLGLTPPGSIHQLFPATVWEEFFINGKSWVAASTEVFLTWGLLGAAAMQIAAHNKHKHLLQRDTSLVIVLTFVVLLLSAFLANTCVQILKHHGYVYTTSSFEKISGYTFMRPVSQPAPPGYSSTPERFMAHASFLVGQRVSRPGVDASAESGYQVLRLSTELVPATLALLGTEQVSPFWAVLFYFTLILFGIAQQLAIWHCVITGIMAINTKMMKLWETTITFFSCACAYILGLPMATELGIYVVYYMDYTVGGAWWIMILYLVQVGAVFAVRGRPHTGEAVVAELFPPTGRCLRHWAGPLLSFTWNVVLPVTLMVLSITIFKNGGFRELYSYRRSTRDYWAVWARQLGAAIPLVPILTIPTVAIIQTCRYLNNGPPDIFDNDQVGVNINHCEQCNGRIQLLYRPSLEPEDPRDAPTHIGGDTSTSIHGNGILSTTTEVPFEDPPPKYTPPPSYTTATGARIAKMLRQSFRRSVRRIANVLGESSAPRQRPPLQPPPPDYATVLVEMNQSGYNPHLQSRDIAIELPDPRNEIGSSTSNNLESHYSLRSERQRPNTIDRATRIGHSERRCVVERTHSTLDRGRRACADPSPSTGSLTAADVANLLRSSIRRGTARTQQSFRRSFCHDEPTAAVSVENLVEAAAPIGEESLVLPKDVSLVSMQQVNDNSNDKKTADETGNSVSVI